MSNLTVFCIVYQEFVLDYCHCFRKPDAMFIFIFSQTSVKLNGKKIHFGYMYTWAVQFNPL